MIDEKRIIAKLEKRIDDFTKAHPDQKDGVSVQIIQEFIHMLELEAKYDKEEEQLWLIMIVMANHDRYDTDILRALQRIANSLERIEKKIESPTMDPDNSRVEKGDTDAESYM